MSVFKSMNSHSHTQAILFYTFDYIIIANIEEFCNCFLNFVVWHKFKLKPQDTTYTVTPPSCRKKKKIADEFKKWREMHIIMLCSRVPQKYPTFGTRPPLNPENNHLSKSQVLFSFCQHNYEYNSPIIKALFATQ